MITLELIKIFWNLEIFQNNNTNRDAIEEDMNVALDADVVLSITRLFYMCIIYSFSVYVVCSEHLFPYICIILFTKNQTEYTKGWEIICVAHYTYCQASSGDISRYSILMILSTKGHSD